MPEIDKKNILNDPKSNFGKWLNDELSIRGWRQNEFSKMSGIPKKQLSKYVLGEELPQPYFAERIAIALQIPPEVVFSKANLNLINQKIQENLFQELWLQKNENNRSQDLADEINSAIYSTSENKTYLANVIKISYKKHFVAFLDVLGFKEMVLRKENNKINDYFSSVQQILDKIPNEKKIRSIIISDSVILSLESNNENSRIDDLRQFCLAVRDIQLNLAAKDIWLRGAIAFGDAYFNQSKKNIVGEAYIAAYDLGENKSIYPRVIIDSKIFQSLGLSSSQDLFRLVNTSSKGEVFEQLLFDWNRSKHSVNYFTRDVPLFINYLAPSFLNIDLLSRIIHSIKKNIYLSQDIYRKYMWVIDYYIALVDQLSSSYDYLSEVYLVQSELSKL